MTYCFNYSFIRGRLYQNSFAIFVARLRCDVSRFVFQIRFKITFFAPQKNFRNSLSLIQKHARERERPPLQPAIMSSDAKSGKKTASKAAATGSSIPVNTNIIVMDNGGDTIKIGFAGQISPTALVPNCACKPHGVKAIIVGLDTLNIPDINGLVIRRPIDRGYLTNSQLQKDIWAHCIHEVLKVTPEEVRKCWMIMTEPPANFSTSRQEMDRILLEEFGFEGVVYVSGALCAMKAHLWQTKDEDLEGNEEEDANAMEKDDTDKEYVDFNELPPKKHTSKRQRIKWAREAMTGCVLDVGFSFAHASPIFDGKVADHHVKRLNLGGRALTNYLKELVSYRQWNVMDEFALIEDVKVKSVYCQENGDIYEVLKEAKKKIRENKIAVKYVLPDGVNTLRGFLADSVLANDADDASSSESEINEDDDLQTRRRKLKKQKEKATKGAGSMELAPDAQSLVLVNERFMVPEILFHPTDIGLNQCGITELIAQSVHHHEANDSLRDQAVEALMWLNIIVTGGCTKIPGLIERLTREIRQYVPATYSVSVRALDDPISDIFLGLSLLSCTDDSHAPIEDPVQHFCLKHGTKRDEYIVKNSPYKAERISQYDRFESKPLGRVKDMHCNGSS